MSGCDREATRKDFSSGRADVMIDDMTQTSIEHITSKPEVCGGKPCIAGSRIRVQDIYVWHELNGLSPDEIVTQFPSLSLADVYAALAFYWDHRDDIHQQMSDETAVYEQMKQKYPSLLEQIRAAKHAPNHSVPS